MSRRLCIDVLARIAVNAAVFGIWRKRGVGRVITCDVLPGVAMLTEHGRAIESVIVEAADTLDRVRLFFDAIDNGLLLRSLWKRTVTRVELSVDRWLEGLSHNPPVWKDSWVIR